MVRTKKKVLCATEKFVNKLLIYIKNKNMFLEADSEIKSKICDVDFRRDLNKIMLTKT